MGIHLVELVLELVVLLVELGHVIIHVKGVEDVVKANLVILVRLVRLVMSLVMT